MSHEDRILTALNRHFWRWLGYSVCLVLALAAVRSTIADWSEIPTGSMTPAILPGDRIYVNKLAYDLKLPFTMKRLLTWSDPHRGDIVILISPVDGKLLVKRVIAVPGDVIPMPTNPLKEIPLTLPSGKFFFMGDNRDHSFDSRYFGLVDRNKIVGKAIGVVVSLDPNHHSLPRWGRFMAALN